MPELPEVEIVRRGLEYALANKVIQSVTINRRDLRVYIPDEFEQRILGCRIEIVQRRGKYILAFTDRGYGFVLHLGMSGRIRIYQDQEEQNIQKHDHCLFNMDDGTRIVFNDPRRFGMLYLTHQETWEKELPFNRMGPEPLGNEFSGIALWDKLKERRASIKAALLDQTIVTGVGNIYACEALYEAEIDPMRAAGNLSRAEVKDLVKAIRSVLNKAIRAGGSTLRDYAQTDGNLGYFQHYFSVYDREGVACPDCDCDMVKSGGIKRIKQSGRSTFYCAERQR